MNKYAAGKILIAMSKKEGGQEPVDKILAAVELEFAKTICTAMREVKSADTLSTTQQRTLG